MLTLILGGVAAALGGAYVGTVVANATEAPNTVIKAEEVKANSITSLSGSDWVKAAALGGVAFVIYKKFIKKGK